MPGADRPTCRDRGREREEGGSRGSPAFRGRNGEAASRNGTQPLNFPELRAGASPADPGFGFRGAGASRACRLAYSGGGAHQACGSAPRGAGEQGHVRMGNGRPLRPALGPSQPPTLAGRNPQAARVATLRLGGGTWEGAQGPPSPGPVTAPMTSSSQLPAPFPNLEGAVPPPLRSALPPPRPASSLPLLGGPPGAGLPGGCVPGRRRAPKG